MHALVAIGRKEVVAFSILIFDIVTSKMLRVVAIIFVQSL